MLTQPAVTGILPASGTTAGGNAVTITGTGFVTGATVTVGGAAATGVSVGSATSITATTPSHAVGAVDVVVTNPDTQTGTLTNGFTYTAPPGAPTVTGIEPGSGQATGGDVVTISGTGFVTGATVTFGGAAATGVTVDDPATITATTPAHAAGAVDVVVTNPDTQTGTLTNGFTYTAPPTTVPTVVPTTAATTAPALAATYSPSGSGETLSDFPSSSTDPLMTVTVNIGGDSKAWQAVVTGTKLQDLIVTGTEQHGPFGNCYRTRRAASSSTSASSRPGTGRSRTP